MTLYRTCTKCFLEKPIEEFGWKDRTINKRHAVCKECTAKRSSEWYYNNREHHIQSVKANSDSYRNQAREYVYQYLSNHPCVECGETDPIVLEFHHLGNKEAEIAAMVGQGTSLEKIIKEIEKCEVLCGNCHKRKTAKERGWFRSRR
jgi:hypothetical protein